MTTDTAGGQSLPLGLDGLQLDLAQLDAQLDEIDRERARKNFHEFRRYVTRDSEGGSTFVDTHWQRVAARELQRFFDALMAGKRPKLILQTPPQHGKSHMLRDFMAWCLGRCPDLREVYASYADDLGVAANMHLQRLLDSKWYQNVFPDTRLFGENVVTQAGKPRRNQKVLEVIDSRGVNRRGCFRNTTIQGPLTGQPCDLGVIDDPVKDRAQAESEVERAKAWDWFNNVFLTRLSKRSGYVIILTRWHLDDLAGKLLKERDDITLVTFKAIAEEDEPELGRKAGGCLCPELQPLDLLMDKKRTLSPEDWSALFQQNPVPRGGAMLKAAWFATRYKKRGTDPKRVLQSWDCASKIEERNDPSACLTIAEFDDHFEIWDCEAERREFPDLVARVKLNYENVHKRGPAAPNGVLVEDKDAGQALIQQLRRDTKMPVVACTPHKDKPSRMMEETPVVEAGKVWLPESAPWLEGLLQEFITFPSGAHDDRVDTFSQALKYIREHSASYDVPAPVSVKKGGMSVRRVGKR